MNEVVEAVDVKWCPAIVYICLYAVFLYLTLAMVVVVMMVMLVFIVVMVMFMMVVFVFVVVVVAFDCVNPCCGSGYPVEIEHVGVENFRQVDVAVVAFDDFCFGLERTDNGPDAAGFLAADFRNLVEKNNVAELNLLDDEVFDIVFCEVLALQFLAACKFALHTQCVDYSDDTVELWNTVADIFSAHVAHG